MGSDFLQTMNQMCLHSLFVIQLKLKSLDVYGEMGGQTSTKQKNKGLRATNDHLEQLLHEVWHEMKQKCVPKDKIIYRQNKYDKI